MQRLKLLIADGGEDFTDVMISLLQETYLVHCCRSGKEALDYLQRNPTDILVLDLMIPELDGISLLQRLSELGIHPMVLATTRFVTDYIADTAQELGVGYMMTKPCDPRAAAARVKDLTRRIHPRTSSETSPQTAASALLFSLSVAPHLRGSPFLQHGLVMMAERPDLQITKEVYPAIAASFSATDIQVERAIRNAIHQAWEQRDEEIWRQYFRPDSDGNIPRPSNGAFLSRLAEVLRAKLEG